MPDESFCNICEAGFRPEAVKEGVCNGCAKNYPGAKTKEDILKINKPKARTMSEATVKEIVIETLEEAGIKRKKCERCGKLFFPKSPASKFCGCQKEEDNKENK